MTVQEFRDKINAQYPATYWILHYYDPTSNIVFLAYKDYTKAALPYNDIFQHSDFAWSNNLILKDNLGLFSPPTPATLSGSNTYNCVQIPPAFTITLDENGNWVQNKNELQKAVCECGKDKHGFASHSRWCQKFEENL